MLKKNINNIYQSTVLSQVPGLIHGYSTRALGDMRKDVHKKQFLKMLGLHNVKGAQQVHGDKVAEVGDNQTGVISDVDGLLTKNNGCCVGVHVADCVPILLVDPVTQTVCAVHAGWRGTLGGIAKHAVSSMKKKGARAENILVSIGPHIGMCSYDVGHERAEKFLTAFNHDPKVASRIGGTWHLDIGYANFLQLIAEGIKSEHIDALPTCTWCQITEFFSYRKDAKETYGEIMGVIGYGN